MSPDPEGAMEGGGGGDIISQDNIILLFAQQLTHAEVSISNKLGLWYLT